MKTSLDSATNNRFNKPNTKLSFGYGWNSRVAEGIKCCNVSQITEDMAKKGIIADFAGNKVVAWCSNQSVKIFETLNQRFGLQLDLPKRIFVTDFAKLKINKLNDCGACNWYPARLAPGSKEIFPERTVLFNSFESKLQTLPQNLRWKYGWDNIDSTSERLYRSRTSSSSHFLAPSLHEFVHSAHNSNWFKKLGPQETLERLKILKSNDYLAKFNAKYGAELSHLSESASKNPLEAAADNMSGKIIASLDASSLLPATNPFNANSHPSDKIIKRIWDGEVLL